MWWGDALSARFAVAAVLLAVGLRLRGVPIRPLPGEWLPIVALGAVGYAGESTLFYLSMTHGTAGACIMLFYAYPAVVTAIGLSRNQIRLTIRSLLALASATAGAVTVVAFGGALAISTTGVVLALSAAAAYGGYLVLGREFTRQTDAMCAACWVAAGAAGSSAARGVITSSEHYPSGHVVAVLAYGAVTAVAFSLTFAALSRIGAGQTAVVMTLEAVSTVVLAAVVLGESMSWGQACGGVAIIGAAVVIAASPSDEDRTVRRKTLVRS